MWYFTRVIRESPKPRTLAAFVDALQASGRYTFEKADALKSLKLSRLAFKSAARRLVAKERLVAPRRGFFVIVPLEYRSAGAPPPSWYIDALMRFHRLPYYVGLLSAAALHGAAHQQPLEFQVVTSSPLRPARAGRARLRFFTKRHIERTSAMDVKTETGTMRVSTPEATALDIVRYTKQAGHLSHVATVLTELAENLNGRRLLEAAQGDVELSCLQRLGFLLEHVGAAHVAKPLARWLSTRHLRLAPLRPDRACEGVPIDPRWSLLVNEAVEADL